MERQLLLKWASCLVRTAAFETKRTKWKVEEEKRNYQNFERSLTSKTMRLLFRAKLGERNLLIRAKREENFLLIRAKRGETFFLSAFLFLVHGAATHAPAQILAGA